MAANSRPRDEPSDGVTSGLEASRLRVSSGYGVFVKFSSKVETASVRNDPVNAHLNHAFVQARGGEVDLADEPHFGAVVIHENASKIAVDVIDKPATVDEINDVVKRIGLNKTDDGTFAGRQGK